MSDTHKGTETEPVPTSNDLAVERTMLSHERTLMAWIRTATAMISFGFTMYKLFEEVSSKVGKETILTPRLVGIIMIAFGLLALLLAQFQHTRSVRRLKKYYPDTNVSISSILSLLILLFGFALFLGALLRQ